MMKFGELLQGLTFFIGTGVYAWFLAYMVGWGFKKGWSKIETTINLNSSKEDK